MNTSVAHQTAQLLQARNLRVVFAESCTAGWISALLSAVPGVSNYHCGALVTYREASKQAWLQVDADTLAQHTAVSPQVTRLMAEGALRHTEEAAVAMAITGHVGPHAPPKLDGVCFVAIAWRDKSASIKIAFESQLKLASDDRVARQHEAAETALAQLVEFLQ